MPVPIPEPGPPVTAPQPGPGPFPYGTTLTRVRRAGRDRNNDPTGTAVELDVPGCVVWPTDGNGTSGNEQTDRADTVVIGYTAMLPPDTDVKPTDQWRYGGALFEQVGEAGRYVNGFVGTRVLTIVLRRTTG